MRRSPIMLPSPFSPGLTLRIALIARIRRSLKPPVGSRGCLAGAMPLGDRMRNSRNLSPNITSFSPLQLDSDYQLRAHSDFDGMQPALAEIVASFAATAPQNRKLVIKAHPLDNGLTDWRARTLDYAKALGVAGRVIFLDAGDITALVQNACGVVTVNSTTGTLALQAGIPVLALGRSIYGLRGLTHQGDLNGFWSAPTPPDPELYDAFRRVVAVRCLLRGGFYTDERHAPLVAAAADRISDGEMRWVPVERRPRLRERLAASLVPAE